MCTHVCNSGNSPCIGVFSVWLSFWVSHSAFPPDATDDDSSALNAFRPLASSGVESCHHQSSAGDRVEAFGRSAIQQEQNRP
ncbi:hypothetical protein FKM82_023373 [Ascaphus truei]